MTFDIAELYCGMAAVSLAATGCSPPPVSRVGSKTGYVVPILRELGIERGTARTALLVDSDPWVVSVLSALFTPSGRDGIVERLSKLCAADARVTWSVAAQHVRVPMDEAARLFTRGRLDPAQWLLYTAGARGGIGGFKGGHKLRPNVDGFIPSRKSLVKRIADFRVPETVGVTIKLATAGSVDAERWRARAVYLDPPYDSSDLLHLPLGLQPAPEIVADRWRRTGARVAISSDAPLRHLLPPAWRSVAIGDERVGQVRRSLVVHDSEFVTVSVDP